MSNRLGNLYDALEESSKRERATEEEWFSKNPPIKEFSIEREGELVVYGIWDSEEEITVIFKTPDGKYHKKYKQRYDKELIKELNKFC